MKFGEKIRALRRQRKLTQDELAEHLGVSKRTIAAYESCASYPRRREIYEQLAQIFGVDVNYLRAEDEEFVTAAAEEYGSRGRRQAEAILAQAGELFAGGSLSETDEIRFLTELQQLYIDSKQRAKRFTPRRYLGRDDQ